MCRKKISRLRMVHPDCSRLVFLNAGLNAVQLICIVQLFVKSWTRSWTSSLGLGLLVSVLVLASSLGLGLGLQVSVLVLDFNSWSRSWTSSLGLVLETCESWIQAWRRWPRSTCYHHFKMPTEQDKFLPPTSWTLWCLRVLFSSSACLWIFKFFSLINAFCTSQCKQHCRQLLQYSLW